MSACPGYPVVTVYQALYPKTFGSAPPQRSGFFVRQQWLTAAEQVQLTSENQQAQTVLRQVGVGIVATFSPVLFALKHQVSSKLVLSLLSLGASLMLSAPSETLPETPGFAPDLTVASPLR